MSVLLNWWPAGVWAACTAIVLLGLRDLFHTDQWVKAYMTLVLLELSPFVVISATRLNQLIPDGVQALLALVDLALWILTMVSYRRRARFEAHP